MGHYKNSMDIKAHPRPFLEWRDQPVDREEDAAYTFGYHLIVHCRDKAIASLPADASPETSAAAEKAVDVALASLTDMLEGFWKLKAGPQHTIALALAVRVLDSEGKLVESQEISPCKLDLPIGYWKWAHDRAFR
jgi:hypothetical protein